MSVLAFLAGIENQAWMAEGTCQVSIIPFPQDAP